MLQVVMQNGTLATMSLPFHTHMLHAVLEDDHNRTMRDGEKGSTN